MKPIRFRYLLLLPAVLFPYAFVGMVWVGFKGAHDFNMFMLLFIFAFLWVPVLLITILGCVAICWGKRPSMELSRIAMIWKLVQIPAYVVIFVLCLLMAIMPVWGWILLLVPFFIDAMTIILSGIMGAVASRRAVKEGKILGGIGLVLGVCQFFFVADVICSVILWLACRREKK